MVVEAGRLHDDLPELDGVDEALVVGHEDVGPRRQGVHQNLAVLAVRHEGNAQAVTA